MNYKKLNLKIAAIVVTYKRKDILGECLTALLSQTRKLDKIFVIDNASNDGTDFFVKQNFPSVFYVKLERNTGGAGGFFEGLKRAYFEGFDWMWVMDDDTVPEDDSLEKLVKGLSSIDEENVGVLCSHVNWVDGSPHLMNVPEVTSHKLPFNFYIDKNIIKISSCSFVSALISSKAIEKFGLPLKEMFIYCDDTEYTSRICKEFSCFYLVESKVLHKTKANSDVDIMLISSSQLWRYFYNTRNRVFIFRQKGAIRLLAYFLLFFPKDLKRVLQRSEGKFQAIKVFLSGVIAGLFFYPKIEFPKVRRLNK